MLIILSLFFYVSYEPYFNSFAMWGESSKKFRTQLLRFQFETRLTEQDFPVFKNCTIESHRHKANPALGAAFWSSFSIIYFPMYVGETQST